MRLPDWWPKVWPILLDKGALAILVGTATFLINRSLERFKAEQARLQDFRRERDKVIGDFIESVSELEQDGDSIIEGGVPIEAAPPGGTASGTEACAREPRF